MTGNDLRPKNALHVLVATPLGKGGRGGIDRIMDEIRRELVQQDHAGIEVAFTTTRGQGHILLSPLYLARSIARACLGKMFGRIDVLHINLSSHGSTSRKLLLCRAARAAGLPYIIHLHGSRFRQYYTEADAGKAAQIAEMFRGAARILVLGQVWKEFLISQVPDVAGKIDILPNATRPPEKLLEPSTGLVRVLFLGEVGARKGVPQLVEAFAKLRDVPGWHGIIAGNGRVEETRNDLVLHGLADRVTLTGWVGPKEVEKLLLTSDILVLPSYDENLPMSVIEGMSYALAIVATPVGAVEDIIENESSGLLVPVGDSAALAEALKRLILDPELRSRLGKNAKAFHEAHLDIKSYVKRLFHIWQEVGVLQKTSRP